MTRLEKGDRKHFCIADAIICCDQSRTAPYYAETDLTEVTHLTRWKIGNRLMRYRVSAIMALGNQTIRTVSIRMTIGGAGHRQ